MDSPSIMQPSGGAGNNITKKDVGYLLWKYWMAEAERVNDSRLSVAQNYIWGILQTPGAEEPQVVYVDVLGFPGSISPSVRAGLFAPSYLTEFADNGHMPKVTYFDAVPSSSSILPEFAGGRFN